MMPKWEAGTAPHPVHVLSRLFGCYVLSTVDHIARNWFMPVQVHCPDFRSWLKRTDSVGECVDADTEIDTGVD